MPRHRSAPRHVVAEGLAASSLLTTRWIERLLAAHDPPLTPVQYLALRAIAREPLSAVELARRSGVSGPAVSQLTAALELDGLIVRAVDPSDRRRATLSLSEAGRAALASASAEVAARLGALLGDLPRPEAEALARLLVRVESALGGEPPPRRPGPPRAR